MTDTSNTVMVLLKTAHEVLSDDVSDSNTDHEDRVYDSQPITNTSE